MLVLAVKRRRREETKIAKESQPTSAAGDGAGAVAFAWSFDGADEQMWSLFYYNTRYTSNRRVLMCAVEEIVL